MPFAATWVDLEVIILNEVNQTEKDKYHMISFMCGIEMQMQSTGPYSTRNYVQYIQYFVIYNRKESENVYVQIYNQILLCKEKITQHCKPTITQFKKIKN